MPTDNVKGFFLSCSSSLTSLFEEMQWFMKLKAFSGISIFSLPLIKSFFVEVKLGLPCSQTWASSSFPFLTYVLKIPQWLCLSALSTPLFTVQFFAIYLMCTLRNVKWFNVKMLSEMLSLWENFKRQSINIWSILINYWPLIRSRKYSEIRTIAA